MPTPTRDELREAIEVSLEILASPTETESLAVRELPSVRTRDGAVLVGIDSSGLPHLLLAICADSPKASSSSGGVTAGRRKLAHDHGEHEYLDVVCRVPRLRRLFGLLCTDILERVADGQRDPEQIVTSTLEEWRELVARAQQPIDESRARGLFGELHQLSPLVALNGSALDLWRGPEAVEHDLSNGRLALEVKSTARRGNTVEIHGIRQLAEPTGGELVLVVQVVESRQAGRSLSDIADEILKRVEDPRNFWDRLALLGIDRDDDVMRNYRFRVVEERAFRVTADFPRLVEGDLSRGHLHPSIRRLAYTIDLSNVGPPLEDSAVDAFRGRMAES